MNLTKELKKGPIPPGVFVVRGPQGVGKTSFCTAMLCADYKKWTSYRTEQGQWLAKLYEEANKGIKLKVSDRLYFSNIKILLNKKKHLNTHYVDVQRLGLPNGDFEVQYLPRGSVIYIQEADVLLFCRDYATLNTYLINLLKYVRHNLLTIIFDCQVDSALDAAVRRLTMGLYHIERSYDTRFFLFWKIRRWKFMFINYQLNEVMKDLAEMGVKKKVSVLQKGTFRCFGNIFARYDSFSGLPYFLYGIEKVGYKYLPYPPNGFTVEDINAFVLAHPLERPKSMKKKKEEPTEKPAKNGKIKKQTKKE